MEQQSEECIYCGALVPYEDVDYVPPVDDNEEWEKLAQEHYEDCEWIAKRAFRVGMWE